jgi:hypothetical protein
MKKYIMFFILWIFSFSFSFSQDDLEALLNEEMGEGVEYATSTFHSTRIIHTHSVEKMPAGGLDFRIAHRFGEVTQGFYELFGLDYASSYLSWEYGMTDWLMGGVGRATYEKTWTGFLKARLLRQAKGEKNIPVTVNFFTSLYVDGRKFADSDKQSDFTGRLDYVHQLLVARKFTPDLSFQLSPTFIHRNLVASKKQNNDLFAMGIGGRYKISNRFALTGEYFYVHGLEDMPFEKYYHPVAVGVDIQVSGHVFQLHFTNAGAMTENNLLGQTTSGFFDGDVRFGFNISQVFTLNE